MLCSKNSGKLLKKRFEEVQAEVMTDARRFTAAEQSFYGVAQSGLTGAKYQLDGFVIETPPVDAQDAQISTITDSVDVRKRPQCGD